MFVGASKGGVIKPALPRPSGRCGGPGDVTQRCQSGALSVAELQWVMKHRISFYSVLCFLPPAARCLAWPAVLAAAAPCCVILKGDGRHSSASAAGRGAPGGRALPQQGHRRGSVPASTPGCFYLFRLNIYPCLVLPRAPALSRSLPHDLRRLFSSTRWREARATATATRHPLPPLPAPEPRQAHQGRCRVWR